MKSYIIIALPMLLITASIAFLFRLFWTNVLGITEPYLFLSDLTIGYFLYRSIKSFLENRIPSILESFVWKERIINQLSILQHKETAQSAHQKAASVLQYISLFFPKYVPWIVSALKETVLTEGLSPYAREQIVPLLETIQCAKNESLARALKLLIPDAQQEITVADLEYLERMFRELERKGLIKKLMIGTRQYLKILIFKRHLIEGRTSQEIWHSLGADLKELEDIKQQTEGLPTTGCEIGFPIRSTEEERGLIELQAQIEGFSAQERIVQTEVSMSKKAYSLAAVFNFFMETGEGNSIPGVRHCYPEDGSNVMDLRILPSNHIITERILDIYVRDFKLFTDEELISSSYATTVSGLFADWRGAFITAASFYCDRVWQGSALTVDDILPPEEGSLGHPGAMPWRAVAPQGTTAQTIKKGKVTRPHSQMTLNYHMLAVGFEEATDQGRKLRVFLQYPPDYQRIAYLANIAQDKKRFDGILERVLDFYVQALQLEREKVLLALGRKNLEEAITETAQLLRLGFFTRYNFRSNPPLPISLTEELTEKDKELLERLGFPDAHRKARSFGKIRELFLAHQEIVDGIAQREKLARLNLGGD
ncbi:hypothetical protein ACFL11_00050 [Patescibacteria group bacterium]